MNHYQARRMRNDDGSVGLWHWTCQNDGRIWAEGYCAQGCPGHETAEEAAEHYRQYMLDTADYSRSTPNQQQKCRKCGAWTQGYATSGPGGMTITFLCDEHRNRETLAELLSAPQWISASW